MISRLFFGEQGIDQFRSIVCVACCLWLSCAQVLCGWVTCQSAIKLSWSFPFIYGNQDAWSFVVNFFGISLMTVEVEFLCLCLLAFGVSIFFKWLFKCFAHFSIGFSVFCLLKSRSYFNILNVILLLDVCWWKKIFLKVLHPDNLRSKTMRINSVVLSMTMYGRFLSKGQREELGIYTWYLHSGLLRHKMPNSS